MQQVIHDRVEETVDAARREPPDAQVRVQQRLMRERGDDHAGHDRGIGAA